MAAATLVGAPPVFFKKLFPSESGLPLSVQIISINASPMQRVLPLDLEGVLIRLSIFSEFTFYINSHLL